MAFLAVSLSSVLGESTTSKGTHAERAYEMLRVPLLVQSIHHTSSNCLSTPRTQAPRLLMVVSLAVGLTTILVEGATAEGLLAVVAHKVLGMPLLSQGVDTLTLDRLIAPCTPRTECIVEAPVTVWPSFLLEEGAAREGTETLTTDEVL